MNKTKKWKRITNKYKTIKNYGKDIKSQKYKYKNRWFIKHLSSDTPNIKYVTNAYNNKLIGKLSNKQISKILLFSQFYNQQTCQTYCASASIVIILNIINRTGKLTLKFPYLMENTFLPYPIITQRSLYNIISQTEAMGTYKGLTLIDIKNIFDILDIKSTIIYPPINFKKKFIESIYIKVNKPNTYVLLNYGCAWKKSKESELVPCLKGRQESFKFVDKRDAIFWKNNKFPYEIIPRGGHVAPIATAVKYKNKFWFLIVEIANFKYSWFWMNGEAIYDTISTIDNATNKPRGLVIINDN